VPERFDEAHRLVMRGVEMLDRDGFRDPPVVAIAPLRPIAKPAVEFVAKFIVPSHSKVVIDDLLTLYTQRESPSKPGSAERRSLTRVRVDVQRLAPSYSGGGIGALVLLAVGAAIPALASLSQQIGGVDLDSRWVLAVVAIPLLLFVRLSWLLRRGADVAQQSRQLIMRQPLTALWETIGAAGDPPEDDSILFATIAIALTALVWFALPALIGVGFLIFRRFTARRSRRGGVLATSGALGTGAASLPLPYHARCRKRLVTPPIGWGRTDVGTSAGLTH
jgi:hypothetical protein